MSVSFSFTPSPTSAIVPPICAMRNVAIAPKTHTSAPSSPVFRSPFLLNDPGRMTSRHHKTPINAAASPNAIHCTFVTPLNDGTPRDASGTASADRPSVRVGFWEVCNAIVTGRALAWAFAIPAAPSTIVSATIHAVNPKVPILAEIVEQKRREVEAAKARTPFAELEGMVAQEEEPRNFFAAVTRHPSLDHTSVIAEIKRKSPSAGLIRAEYEGDAFAPEDIAKRYHKAGAAAISCLTDEHFFDGRLSFIQRVKDAVPRRVERDPAEGALSMALDLYRSRQSPK